MVHLHSGAATDVGRVREINQDAYFASRAGLRGRRRHGRPPGRRGGQPRSWSRSSRGWPITATTAPAAPRSSPSACAASQRRIREYGDGEPRRGRSRLVRRHHRRRAAALSRTRRARSGCWPTSATPASTASTRAPSTRSASTTRWSRSCVDAGKINAARGRRPPGAARDHPRARRPGAPRARLLPAAARLRRAAAALLRRRERDDRRRRDRGRSSAPVADPRDAAERIVAAAVDAGGRTTPPPSWSMWWDWRTEEAHDSSASPVSLEDKLGALP